jgi:diguanylate cyclase (GGDEF)-like protein
MDWETAQTEGLDHFSWMHPDDPQVRRWVRSSLEKKKNLTLSNIALRWRGQGSGIYQLNVVPFQCSDTAFVGVMLIYRDISSEIRLQKEVRSLLHREQQRHQDLETMVEVRTRELKTKLDDLVFLSRQDPLTGLLNRRAFQDSVTPMMSLLQRHRRRGAILLCDLDNFKSVNDRFGHKSGDMVLTGSAAALKACLRKEDLLCRYGGEEFVIFLSEIVGDGVEVVAQRCLQAVTKLPVDQLISADMKPQTMSMGIALIPEHGFSLEALIGLADDALYHSKKNGRNCFSICKIKADSGHLKQFPFTLHPQRP